ncbi:histidine kinase [Virgisporangium aliadipatigenens]|uniref:histidine kinase n=1 Tax=Virgisporangium aliadipatigenens TaxID=741659 RepID=A0A8J4DVW1_9ACTN|nr:nitrate- and nitrite sensing domain-containing protein [Virgisporangium aliadipatigenens]GIJ51866.1 histidine kinase [Virgisporangium aliadipatigenens]
MRNRSRSIRRNIAVLLVPPFVSLVALWIFATTLAAGSALDLLNANSVYQDAGKPAEAMVVKMQEERRLSQAYLAGNRNDARKLTEARTATDRAIADFRAKAGSDTLADADALLKPAVKGLLDATVTFVAAREQIDGGQIDRGAAMKAQTQSIDAAYRLFAALPSATEREVSRDARTSVQLSRARELLHQEDALLAGILVAGKFQAGEPAQWAQAVGAQRFLYAEVLPEVHRSSRPAFQKIFASDAGKQLKAFEDKLLNEARVGGPVPADVAAGWADTFGQVAQELRRAEFAAGESVVERATPAGIAVLLRLAGAALLGLLAITISVIVSVRVGRSLVRRLTGLRGSAETLAQERLPSVVARLRAGETVDVAAESPPLDLGSDEIGAVGAAFNRVQRTAVESAVQEARLRAGLSNVFLNIARRSQTLLHRQLTLLDKMERRAADPHELEDLFRIDHLATRMRRHAEDLVILAGAAPGRGWRHPVPLVDVVRGAVSEVEDYARVTVAVPETSVAGRAVADVIHLLAELIENATSFSPPHTKVQVGGDLVPNGLAIEIEDRGLGMAAEAIDDANQRLAGVPEFDPSNSARLGLLVVGILAGRHGIRVTLRPSPYGGVTAIVLIPPDLIGGTPRRELPSADRAPDPAPNGGPSTVDGRVPASRTPLDERSAIDLVANEITLTDLPPIVDGLPVDAAVSPTGVAASPTGVSSPTAVSSPTGGASPTGFASPTASARDGKRVPGSAEPMGTLLPGTLPSGAVDPASAPAPLPDIDLPPLPSRRRSAPTPASIPTGPPAAPARTAASAPTPTAASAPVSAPASTPAGAPVSAPASAPTSAPVEAAAGDGATVVDPAPAEAGTAVEAESDDDGLLPRRRRQENLPPQLRDGPPPPLTSLSGESEADDEPTTRSPAEVLAMMSALQAGLARGRREAGGIVPSDPPASTGDAEGDHQ